MKKKQNNKNSFLIVWSTCVFLMIILVVSAFYLHGTMAIDPDIANGTANSSGSSGSSGSGSSGSSGSGSSGSSGSGSSGSSGSGSSGSSGSGSSGSSGSGSSGSSGSGSSGSSGYCSGVGGIGSKDECTSEGGVWIDPNAGSSGSGSSGSGSSGNSSKPSSSTGSDGTVYTCPSGYYIQGYSCINSSNAGDIRPASSSKPSSGGNSSKPSSSVGSDGTVYTCPSGYYIQGYSCINSSNAGDIKPASSSKPSSGGSGTVADECYWDIWNKSYFGSGCVAETDRNGNKVLDESGKEILVPNSNSDNVVNVDKNSDGTYTIIEKDGENVVQTTYSSDYEKLTTITWDEKGNVEIVTDIGGKNKYFYSNESQCLEKNDKCVYYANVYFSEDVARLIIYDDQETCEELTGRNCDELDGDFVGEDCCEDGKCSPEKNIPSVPSKPTTTNPVTSIPEKNDNPSNSSNPTSSSKPSSSNDRGEGCYKNKDTGEFKWFNSDPELKSQTNLYEKVDDSKCEPDSNGNITENPQTGEIAIFLIWILGFGAVGYSVWYYIKSRKEN